MSSKLADPLWVHINDRCNKGCVYCRITELEAQNKILSDSIKAGTNVYKSKWKRAEQESIDRGNALKEIIRLASEYTPRDNESS